MDMRDAFFKALYERASRDPSIVILAGDHGAFWLDKFANDYPSQYVNCGIAEQNMISVAAGLALAGKKPFVYGINNFLTLRAFEQIAVDICQMKLPVVLIGVGAGYTYSTDGPTHHGVCDMGAMMSLPITIYNCSDPGNSDWFARTVEGPAYIRIEKGVLPALYPPKRFNDGMGILRLGEPMTIASGYMVHEAMKRPGGVLEIYRFPIDADLLAQTLRGRGGVRVLEDNNHGPIAPAVAKVIAEHGVNVTFESVAPAGFVFEYGSREYLHEKAGLAALRAQEIPPGADWIETMRGSHVAAAV